MDADMNDTSLPGSPTFANLEDFQHHTLRFEYPAFDLLPPGKQPFIEIPQGVPDREEPELSALGLSDKDLAFFVRFPSEHGVEVDGSPGKRQQATLTGAQPLNLTAAVYRLSSFAGVSDLRFVSFVDDWDVISRFQLKTTFYTNFGKLDDQAQEFELGSADVAKLIRTTSDKEEWVRQLDDLIHAKSDRAYLYRYNQIADWDEEWLEKDESSWTVHWDARDLVPPRQLFANRLRSVWQTADGTIMRERLGELDTFKDQALYVELPCGHRAMTPQNWIHDMHVRDVLSVVCDHCDARIMRQKDLQRVRCFFDTMRRYDWEDRMEIWLPKCKRVRNDASLVEISSGTLSASLLNALDTFKLPKSINPPSLCPTSYPESRALLAKLTDALKAHSTLPAMTPKAMLTNLEKLAWQLLEGMVGNATLLSVVLPPGFDDFVTRWLTRAVNDAVGTQADEEKDDDMMDVVTKMGRAKIDPKAAEVEDDLDEILKQIGETSVGGGDAGEGGSGTQQDDDDDEEL